MDKYDILEYSWVKATMVSVRLRIPMFALINTNKISGAVAGDYIPVSDAKKCNNNHFTLYVARLSLNPPSWYDNHPEACV